MSNEDCKLSVNATAENVHFLLPFPPFANFKIFSASNVYCSVLFSMKDVWHLK